MKAILNSKSQLVADLLRERRRRRCEASGEPFEELPLRPVSLRQARVYQLQRRCEWPVPGLTSEIVAVRASSNRSITGINAVAPARFADPAISEWPTTRPEPTAKRRQ